LKLPVLGAVERGSAFMSPIIALSFCFAVAGGTIGVEWSQLSGVAFGVAALAGTAFLAALDASEAQPDSEDSEATM
jgi:hypothetical protein